MNTEVLAPARQPLALRRTALLCALLMAVVVVASAFLRHHGATPALQAAWAGELVAARWVHRVAATLVLLGAVAMLWLARRARDAAATRGAVLLLGLALLLSAVGVAAGASRAVPVVLVNLLGGWAMLALCVRLLVVATPRSEGAGRAQRGWLALVALQAAAGSMASTQASAQCGWVDGCSLFAVAHRASGVLLALALLVWGARRAWRDERWEGAALAVIALLMLMIGVLAAGLGSSLAPPVLVVGHNGLGVAAVVVLVAGRRT
jgi:heme a synthase